MTDPASGVAAHADLSCIAVFGGEHSGHYYFRDHWCADSGMLAARCVLTEFSRGGLMSARIDNDKHSLGGRSEVAA